MKYLNQFGCISSGSDQQPPFDIIYIYIFILGREGKIFYTFVEGKSLNN